MGRRTVLLTVVVVSLVVVAPSAVAGADPVPSVAESDDPDLAVTATDDPDLSVVASDDPDDARLTITDVVVSPATPVTGEPVELDVTLRNSAGSPSPVALNYVLLRSERGQPLVNATDLGTLSQGDTLTIPLSANFSRAGEKRLELVAVGTDDEGNQTRVTRPVSVVVEQAPPLLDVTVDGAVAGSVSRVEVTVSNPTEAPVRNLTLSASGDGVVAVDGRRAVPTLAAGGSQTINLSVRPETVGETTVRVTLGYTTAAGTTDRTRASRLVRIASLETDVGVAVSPQIQQDQQQVPTDLQGLLLGGTGGSTTQQSGDEERPSQVQVTVTNFGNAPVSGVVITPQTENGPLPRQAIDVPLAPGESASVVVDLSTIRRPGTVTFEVSYRTADEAGTASTAYEYRPETGTIRLTGVSMQFEDGQLVVQGNAGNVGGADVEGVVVSVGDTEFVDPAYPHRNYFVGTVDGSEFVPFELTADVDAGNVSVIPVTIEYSVDGYEFSRTVELPYDDGLDPDPESDRSGFPPWALLLGGLVVALLVAGGLALYRRREE